MYKVLDFINSFKTEIPDTSRQPRIAEHARGTYVLKHSNYQFDRDKSEKDARGIGLTRAVLDSGRLRRV